MSSLSQFSLSWDAHKRNICTGLSSLQQNGEFVDMTLAADSHHVKVHQVIIAVASPYIKELIASAQCPHPVIFLNKISYTTLSAILEYIYTGEVLVSIENLNELITAAKELHIKGLEDMNIHKAVSSTLKTNKDISEDEEYYFEVSRDNDNDTLTGTTLHPSRNIRVSDVRSMDGSVVDENAYEETLDEEALSIMDEEIMDDPKTAADTDYKKSADKTVVVEVSDHGVMQYTVSNQGSLQMILNRFVYYLKHTNKGGTRQWRCVDYLNAYKCPALVVTRDDVVLQRISSHIHPFHDKRILRKVEAGAIFSAIQEAEIEEQSKREEREAQRGTKVSQRQYKQDNNADGTDQDMDYTV